MLLKNTLPEFYKNTRQSRVKPFTNILLVY